MEDWNWEIVQIVMEIPVGSFQPETQVLWRLSTCSNQNSREINITVCIATEISCFYG